MALLATGTGVNPLAEIGTCPVCCGSRRIPVGDNQHARKYPSYDAATDTTVCMNCGAQHQWGRATGLVYLRADGTPCVHEYDSAMLRMCVWRYACKHCPETHVINSGD